MNDEWLTLIPLAQTTLTLDISGTTILLILMALGAYIGHMRGVRAILTVALGTIAAYLVCVQGGDLIVQVINRFWQNSPKLVAFAAGQDPGAVAAFDPLLTTDLQVPLFFRFIFFIALVAISWFFNKRSKWYGGSPAKHEPLAPVLGVFSGALTALLWANAAGLFYDEYVSIMGPLGYPVGTVLSSLPDLSQFVPSLIVVFILVLVLILVFYMPRILTVPEPPKKS